MYSIILSCEVRWLSSDCEINVFYQKLLRWCILLYYYNIILLHNVYYIVLCGCSQPFGGHYNFQFEFGKQPKDTKSAAWTVSWIEVYCLIELSQVMNYLCRYNERLKLFLFGSCGLESHRTRCFFWLAKAMWCFIWKFVLSTLFRPNWNARLL